MMQICKVKKQCDKFVEKKNLAEVINCSNNTYVKKSLTINLGKKSFFLSMFSAQFLISAIVSLSPLHIITAFPCGSDQPWECYTLLSLLPLVLAEHSSLENIVTDYFLDPAGIIRSQTNAAALSARVTENVSSEKRNCRCGGCWKSGAAC